MFLEKITITQFKNYELNSFDFNQRVIGICGRNGIGKTNLLDAIYYACFTKSYFTVSDNLNIGFGKDGLRLEAMFINKNDKHKVVCMLKPNSKKEFLVNDVLYEKLSQHLGLLPCVMIAPDDIDIINGGSELRRKFMDTLLSQLNKEYLQSLILYNKILQQRNSFLKNAAAQGRMDNALLEILDLQLKLPANNIYQYRLEFNKKLIPFIQQFYKEIANSDEQIDVVYESRLHEKNIESLLMESRSRDLILQRTNVGIHKDDIGILLNGQSFKSTASQGQKKSLLFALKLAEYELIKQTKGFSPVILLDDVFEKLDHFRMNNLLKKVCKENEGQVFITDTHKERLINSFEEIGIQGQIIEL